MFVVFYIRFYTDGMINKILNINIFKILVGDSIYEVKLKYLFCMKKFRNPPKTIDMLLTSFHVVGDFINKKTYINYQRFEKWTASRRRGTIPIVFGIYRRKYFIDILVCNEHREQCQRKENKSLHHWNMLTNTLCRYFYRNKNNVWCQIWSISSIYPFCKYLNS